ncbi:thioredoxin family protein [Demequina sp. NBRC 110055]|uniref:thioredoxin family protein n=1 Tax=Demequina sp. NBRC 110055 TaxID=1570344 RepID=UPI0013565C2C|nr:thioredoxin family protein [Demequina sp. NBRC 110055]
MTATVQFDVFTSAFCGACTRTRAVLARAAEYIPGSTVVEHPIETEPDLAESLGIASTPTVIVRDSTGAEALRLTGVPNVHHVLAAGVRVLEQAPPHVPSP